MSANSYLQLTTEHLRRLDFDYEIVTHRFPNPYRGKDRPKTKTIAIDFGGFGDVQAWKPGHPLLMVNACGPADIEPHTRRYKSLVEKRGRRKQVIRDRIIFWLQSGFRFELWSWEHVKDYGPKVDRSKLTIFSAQFDDDRLTFPLRIESESRGGDLNFG